MTVTPLRYEVVEGVAIRTLDRPQAGNTINLELSHALEAAALRCNEDAAVRCVLLKGTGRLFCAGGDIGSFSTDPTKAASVLADLASAFHIAISSLARMRKPLVTLIQGPAAGAGFSLAMIGDIVLAAHSAHFTAAYGAIGLTPDGGMTWLLPRLVGMRKAQDIILRNRRITAVEAESLGLVTCVVHDADLEGEGQQVARELVRSPTGALSATRALLL